MRNGTPLISQQMIGSPFPPTYLSSFYNTFHFILSLFTYPALPRITHTRNPRLNRRCLLCYGASTIQLKRLLVPKRPIHIPTIRGIIQASLLLINISNKPSLLITVIVPLL